MISMKLRISIVTLLSIVVLLEAGCASHDMAYEKSRLKNPNRTAMTMPAQTGGENGLAPVAAGPSSSVGDLSWGGSISTR